MKTILGNFYGEACNNNALLGRVHFLNNRELSSRRDKVCEKKAALIFRSAVKVSTSDRTNGFSAKSEDYTESITGAAFFRCYRPLQYIVWPKAN